MLDALIDADVTDLEDIAGLKPGQVGPALAHGCGIDSDLSSLRLQVKGLSDENLTKLQSDPRVLARGCAEKTALCLAHRANPFSSSL